jgi:hypothetical protein
MTFTTRSWSSTTALSCALLLQNCQPDYLRATAEGRPSTSPSSASLMHQSASNEPSAVRSSTSPNGSLVAQVVPLLPATSSAHEKGLSTVPSTLATVSSSSTAPRTVAAMPRASHVVPLGDTLGHAPSPDGSVVCVGEVLREVPSNEEENSKLPTKRKSLDSVQESDRANKRACAGESAELDKAKEAAEDVRLFSLKTLGEGEERPCIEQREQSGDPLTVLLDVASSKSGKAIQFLDVLLVAAQDNNCRQQALKALGKIAEASPDMLSECLLSLRAAAKREDKNIRLLALKTLGEVEWKHYFGEVEPAPDLPSDMTAILDSACPFWPDEKVKDTHLLVLIPAKVNGLPFSLNLLRDLIQHPKNGGHKTQYHCSYDNEHPNNLLKAQLGAASPAASYWVLMTRNALPESRSKTYKAQKELVAAHANRTGLPYKLPKALEAATVILTHHVRSGEKLYSNDPWTYTRCQELILAEYGEYPAVVGGFESSGLGVRSYRYSDNKVSGVAGCRKF